MMKMDALDCVLWWSASISMFYALSYVDPPGFSLALIVATTCHRLYELRRLRARGEW
jgi:hypothetical protein